MAIMVVLTVIVVVVVVVEVYPLPCRAEGAMSSWRTCA